MAAYRRVDDFTVTCRLTACTPGSAPGPMLGNEYGKPLPVVERATPFLSGGVEKGTRYSHWLGSLVPSVHWHCWVGNSKGIQPAVPRIPQMSLGTRCSWRRHTSPRVVPPGELDETCALSLILPVCSVVCKHDVIIHVFTDFCPHHFFWANLFLFLVFH